MLWQWVRNEFQEAFLLASLDDFHCTKLVFGNHPIEFVRRKIGLPIVYTF